MTRKGFIPGGVGEAMFALRGRLATVIIRCPSGRFALAGSVPKALTRPSGSAFSPDPVSQVWDTEEEAIRALLSIGVTRFQKADCSWYEVSNA